MKGKMKSAILITYDKEDAVTEAVGLCDAAGYEIIHKIKQGFLKKPKYGISEGVLERLEELTLNLMTISKNDQTKQTNKSKINH